jgi:hypothetical protein
LQSNTLINLLITVGAPNLSTAPYRIVPYSLLEKREPYRDEFLYEESLKIDIYAERFALTALFSCKK